jgi:hypothetical protein
MNRFAKNIKAIDFKKETNTCGPCYYFGFNKLIRWCYHPDKNCMIEDFEKGCSRFSEAILFDKSRKERVGR